MTTDAGGRAERTIDRGRLRAAGAVASPPRAPEPTAGVAARPTTGTAPATDTTALPVALAATGNGAEAIRSWVEGVLGWQPVDGATEHLVPAAVELRDLDTPSLPPGDVPSVLLVDDDAAGERIAEVAARVTPDAVLGWPSGRERLATVVRDVLGRAGPATGSARRLRVGGSAGGVGTTTVALALAGLTAWSGSRTFAAVRGTGLALRGLPAAALSAPDLWSRADAVAGVPSLRAVVVADGGVVPELADGSIEANVIDVGVDPDADVLVCRPDSAALSMLEVTTAAVVVVVGDGPARPRELRRAAAGRRGLQLPWSVRVARAGLNGRVPAGLPGAWLARLEPLAPRPDRGRWGATASERGPDDRPPDDEDDAVHSPPMAGQHDPAAT